ncbi:MAG TPA: HIRAN domain-containing protein [Eoetvoesiella sp.]
MNPLSYIVEPEGLLLTWQPQDEQARPRTRRIVAEIDLKNDNQATFRYLKNTADFQTAIEAGFKGYPAFDLGADEISTGVIETFLRRLPPRKREDFAEFLALHRLPFPFPYSDIALLGYTGARLPSDGFSLVPVFPKDAVPCDLLLEIAGFRHIEGVSTAQLKVNDPVIFAIDHNNPVDSDAIAINHNKVCIGYVNRALKNTFHGWLKTKKVMATIDRINGKPEHPLIYLRIAVR